ncbi:hypothetical protein AKJ53_00975 [candidate division MSBL1 archaeon SCGC-AAA382F02]|uniref:Phosphoesterase n=1 Tax=candidate division MSBL1 archaeon SCGC-AAA382F02 TaxID=1698282 RepID=A0A133VIE8_9EURY|nr:hypothetical protein AKJ53_00975 [candidate division MSBL1 archaeon SCGC-AAA382F02]
MKKIGVIADPHGNLSALEAVLEDMPKVDRIICAGDLVGYGPQPNEVIDLVKSKDILSVLGNHDYAVYQEKTGSLNKLAAKVAEWTHENLEKENLRFLGKLPKKTKIEEKYEIFIAHGTPRKPLKEYLYPNVSNRNLVKMTQGTDTDIIVLGHTHIPLEKMIQGKLILNPGAVGQPRDRNPKASYMVLKLGRKKEVIQNRVSYDIEKTEKKINELELPEKFGTRLHFGW